MISFSAFFKKRGIATKYSGENVLIASEELIGVCESLDAINALTEVCFS